MRIHPHNWNQLQWNSANKKLHFVVVYASVLSRNVISLAMIYFFQLMLLAPVTANAAIRFVSSTIAG